MYSFVLALHSWVRWIALIAGVGATLTAWLDRETPDSRTRSDAWGLALVTALDIQLLLGLLLYLVVSPNMQAIREHFGEAMQSRSLRFWAVEHLTMMLAAVVLAHVGRVLARKSAAPAARRTRMVVCYGLATILMLAGIPWPGLPYGRPLLRV
jgi:uncharacterized BrkB/YihY/UPF0761 family membrane protein